MLLFAGALLMALGLLSGAVLLLQAFGLLSGEGGYTLWATFPLLCLVGFTLIATAGRTSMVRSVSFVCSAVLLLLALAAIAALVLGAAALVPTPSSFAPLWFVLVIGFLFGSLGVASFGRKPAED